MKKACAYYAYDSWRKHIIACGIKRAVWDKYMCKICYDFRVADKLGIDPEILQEYEIHRRAVENQSEHYLKYRELGRKNAMVMIWDFGKFQEATSFKLSCLNITILMWKAGKLEVRYLDTFAEGKQGDDFILAAWEFAISQISLQDIDDVYIWSDGGLRRYFTLTLLTDLATKYCHIYWVINFFAAHHGHSRCDGHFGVLKRLIRAKYAGRLIKTAQEIVDLAASLEDTSVNFIVLDPPSDKTWKFEAKVLISKYMSFEVCLDGTLNCYPLTGVTDGCKNATLKAGPPKKKAKQAK